MPQEGNAMTEHSVPQGSEVAEGGRMSAAGRAADRVAREAYLAQSWASGCEIAFPSWILRKLRGPALSVWLCIAQAGETTQQQILEETGYTNATVQRTLKALEARGLIAVDRPAFVPSKGRRPFTYTIPYAAKYGR
jgi:CRP-like cAMP-binding protein